MADYAISNVPRRVVYAASGTGPYAFTFEILNQTDIAVYKASTLLTLTTDYTVTINANGTGSVTLVTSAGTSNITIVGSKNIQRTTDFTTGGDLFANTLNDELDNQTIFIQQVAETAERGLKAPVVDPTDIAMTLPSKDNRKGKVLAFDSTTGNPVAGPALDAVVTVIEQSANINTVADNIASVNTVAGNTSNINTVAGVSGSVTTVATSISNVNTVADDLNEAVSEINTVAVNIANVNTVGTNITSVNTVAGINAAVSTVSTNVASVNTVATNIANVNATGTNIANVNAVGADLLEPTSEINTVAVDIANVNTVGTNIANVNTVAGISANVTSVAGNSTNINTVATNIANVNNVGNNIANVNSVAGNSTNINAVAGNNTNITTVAGISSNVTTVATNNANVTTVAGSIASVNTNATNIANINQNAANIVAIQGASANATAAASSATDAAGSATSASASAAAASAVALGNEPVRHSVRPSLLLDFANTKTLDPRITYTRASTGTFYDGKTVAKAEENLLPRSEEFNNVAFYGVTGTSVTANSTTAPNGESTAAEIVSTLNAQAIDIRSGSGSVTSVSGQPIVFSVFAKANTHSFLQILPEATILPSAFANFDLSSGAVGSTGGTGVTATITSVGNGWYRCIVTIASALSSISGRVHFYLVDSGASARASSYTGTVGNSLYLWGAQVEQRSSVTAYTATTTARITNYIPALQTAAAGVARFEHNPTTGESLGLEIEEQRTNLFTYSDDWSNAAWTKSASSVTANTVVAPDGTLTADKLVENTATSSHSVRQSPSATVSSAHTFTCYVKAAERSVCAFEVVDNGATGNGFSGYFNLSTGAASNLAVFGNGSGVSASITSVGNGWYRCFLTGTANTSGSALRCNIYSAISVGSVSYAGNGFSGIYIWGAQLEAGSFATSYIPTVASQVTRSADVASMTGTNFSSWYRADEGTVYSEASTLAAAGNSRTAWALGFTSASNDSTSLTSPYATTGRYRALGFVGSTINIDLHPATTFASGSINKAGFAYAANDFALCINSGTVTTDTSGYMSPAIDRFSIGTLPLGANPLSGTIKKVAYYPKRLTNAELQGLTTV